MCKLSAPLGKYQGAWLLDQMLWVRLVKKSPNFLPTWLPFCTSTTMNKNSCCSTSLLTFDVISVPEFSCSNRCAVVSCCCYNLYFHYYIWCGVSFHILFAICISSLVRYLLRSLAHFLLGCLFSYCWVSEIFVYFWNSPLLCLLQIFSPINLYF